MQRFGRWMRIWVLLVSLLAWTPAPRAETVPGGGSADSPGSVEKETGSGPAGEEARERIFRSRRSLGRKILASPKALLLPLAWPTKKFLIFAERVDLANRVRDFFYFNEAHTAGWFPTFSMGGKTSVAGGAGLFHNDLYGQGRSVKVSFLYGDAEEWRMDGLLEAPLFLGGRLETSLRILAGEGKEEDYFWDPEEEETGNGTSPKHKTIYDIDRVGTELVAEYGLDRFNRVRLAATFDFGDVEEGEGSASPIPMGVEGAYGEGIFYVGGVVGYRLDTRDSDYRATRGWVVDLEAGIRTDVSGSDGEGRDLAHYYYNLEVQRYVHLFSVFRTVVIRALLSRTEPLHDDSGVPFYFQPVLDEDHALRGYDRGRWRDRGALLFNLEYRYPIWDTWDGVIFLDEGQVFREYEDIGLDEFHWSAGMGVRFSAKNGFLFRVQAAYSDEKQPQMVFKMEQAF